MRSGDDDGFVQASLVRGGGLRRGGGKLQIARGLDPCDLGVELIGDLVALAAWAYR